MSTYSTEFRKIFLLNALFINCLAMLPLKVNTNVWSVVHVNVCTKNMLNEKHVDLEILISPPVFEIKLQTRWTLFLSVLVL